MILNKGFNIFPAFFPFERTENDISEDNKSPDWSLIQLLILILVIIVVAYYFIVLDSGELCIGFGQTCS